MLRRTPSNYSAAVARPAQVNPERSTDFVVGKNQFGKTQFTWHVQRSPNDGRLECPYCSYKAFRNTQLKYHFMAQHVWLAEVEDIGAATSFERQPTGRRTSTKTADASTSPSTSPARSTTSTPPLPPSPVITTIPSTLLRYVDDEEVSFSSDDTPYLNIPSRTPTPPNKKLKSVVVVVQQ
jgi:hypothetical protein